MSDVAVQVWQLARDEEGHDVVLLRDEQGRVLPILIGVCEAAAIWVMLSPVMAKPFIRRPWTHDLLQTMIERLGAKLDRVVIDGYANAIFYATLHVSQRAREFVIDARPSDAIALLLRLGAPLFVHDEIMQDEALFQQDVEEDDLPDLGDDFE